MAVINEQITVACDTKELVNIRAFIEAAARQCFSDRLMVTKVVMAVDEAVANVMEHAYQDAKTGDVSVAIAADEDAFAVTVTDHGRRFDPNGQPGVDLKDHIRQGKRDGLGIFIIRKIMDEIKYTFTEEQCNVLRMVKYIANGSGSLRSTANVTTKTFLEDKTNA